MTIAVITDGIWPYLIGGMQKHSFLLSKYLAKNRVNVILVHTTPHTLNGEKLASPFLPEEQAYIEEVYVENPVGHSFPGHYLFQSYNYSKRAYEALSGKFKSIDFIIAQGLTGWYFVNNKVGLPAIAIHCHGYEFLQKQANLKSWLQSAMLSLPFRLINKKADFVLSLGGSITLFIKQLNVPNDRIIEMPGGIEDDWSALELSEINGPRKFVFVGRNERRKGIKELNIALAQLVDRSDFEFHFVGPIPDTDKVHARNIFYHGTITSKLLLQDVLRNCHVLVCPSYAEGLPTVILEGMANGCAIIASNVGAVNSLVDATCGMLIAPGKPQDLKAAIIRFIEMETDTLNSLRQGSVTKVNRDFLWSKIIIRLLDKIQIQIGEAS